MRVSRIFVDLPLQVGATVTLPETAAHYVRSVLRLKADQTLILFNGQGGEYHSVLREVSRKQVRTVIEQFSSRDVESPLRIHLGLGVSRGDRMDWSLQKAVELGVSQISPLLTERCVSKLDHDKKVQRHQHWQQIVYHAAEQCGRTRLPSLASACDLDNWLSTTDGSRFLLDPNAQQGLSELAVPQSNQVILLIGPEGGLSETERKAAYQAGFVGVRLGPRILRTETAVLSAIVAVQNLWGDLR